MKKDVIYIDTEDDITAIIDKVKHAGAQIVALVPPKRVGVLQSTVNLRLLQRAADSASKRIVLITNDPALTALAGGLALPIAKNLQSKPEIASLENIESEAGDVINGADLPVGEFAAGMTVASTDKAGQSDVASSIDGIELEPADAIRKNVEDGARKKRDDKGTKIPNFDSFRKRLFLFGGLGVLVIGFLVWAIFFAAQATIAITARTNVVNISKTLQLKSGATLDVSQAVLPVVTKQVKKTVSVDFAATGKKEIGEKATGTVKLSRQSMSTTAVPAGTTLTSTGGVAFTTDTAVTIPASTIGGSCFPTACPGTVNVGVTAVNRGTASNGVSGNLSGAPSAATATLAEATAGGTDKTATVVSADDVTKATEQLKAQDSNNVRDELAKQFDSDVIAVNEAYVVDAGTPTSTPAVDQEATAGKLSVETTYTLLGIKRADLKAVYDNYLATQLKGDSSQKVYASGDETTQFSSFQKLADGTFSVRAIATAQVGPNIDSGKIATDSKDKMIGEVQQSVRSIQGVDSVNVSLSPFWVTKVPGDAGRIKVIFTVQNN